MNNVSIIDQTGRLRPEAALVQNYVKGEPQNCRILNIESSYGGQMSKGGIASLSRSKIDRSTKSSRQAECIIRCLQCASGGFDVH